MTLGHDDARKNCLGKQRVLTRSELKAALLSRGHSMLPVSLVSAVAVRNDLLRKNS